MTELGISVILCAYTEARWEDLVSAVSSVRAQTHSPREIIVVVDHNPILFNRVREGIHDAVAIENVQAPGLSGARNSGLARAQGDVVAFLDDDAVAAPDWLACLVQRYADPRVMGVGGSIEPLWEKSRPRWFPEEFDWVVGCTYRGMPNKEESVRNLIGCNMSFRRGVFEHAGGFRADFGRIGPSAQSCEETEFCIRVGRLVPTHRLSFAPSATVLHRVPSGRGRWSYFRSRCFNEGMAKANLSQLSGSRDGLSSERAYVLSALPRGMWRGVADAVQRGDIAGLARAGAIVAGFALVTAGYLKGTASHTLKGVASREHQAAMLQNPSASSHVDLSSTVCQPAPDEWTSGA